MVNDVLHLKDIQSYSIGMIKIYCCSFVKFVLALINFKDRFFEVISVFLIVLVPYGRN